MRLATPAISACALAFCLGCGGKVVEAEGRLASNLCEFEGASTARLPILLTEFGTSDAIGVGPYGVYLAESAGFGRIVQVPRLGGDPVVLGEYIFYVKLRTGGTDTYAIAEGFAGSGSALFNLTADGRLVTLDTNLKGASDLVVTESSLYVADGFTETLYRYDRSGQNRTLIAEGIGNARLASDGETLYYLATPTTGAGLYRFIPGSDPELVWGGGFGLPHQLLFSEGLLYAAGGGIQVFDLKALVASVVTAEPAGIEEIVRVGANFYVTAGNSNGKLFRVPVTGGTPELLDEGLGWGGLATDGSAVYYDGGAVALVHCPAGSAP